MRSLRPADAVVLDLEEFSGGTGQADRTGHGPDIVRAHTGRDLIVRVNPRGTPWYLADLAAAVPARPAAIMLPKCSGPEDLGTLDHHLEALEVASGIPVGTIGVVAIVTETAASVFTLGAYAGWRRGCVRSASVPRICRRIWVSARAIPTAHTRRLSCSPAPRCW